MQNNVVEILGGGGLEFAFRDLGIEARRTYKRQMPPDDGIYHGEAYECWEISQDALDQIDNISDDDWKSKWGWWRSSDGSNIEVYDDHEMCIKGHVIKAFYSQEEYNEYFQNGPYDEINEPDEEFFEECCNFKDFYHYCAEHLGASTETNVTAIAISTARLNGMKIGEMLNQIG